MDKENVLYTYSKIVLALKIEVNAATSNNMEELDDILLIEISQSKKNIYYMTPLM